MFLEFSQNSQENICSRVSLLIRLRPATLSKKTLWHGCFPVNFAKFLRTPFIQNTSGRLLLKSYEDIYHSPYVSVITRNILITIIRFARYHLPACFQQQFHDWFSVLRYNTDLAKLEWTLLLFNFNEIRDLANRRKLFSITGAGYASFSNQTRTFKTNLLRFNVNFF